MEHDSTRDAAEVRLNRLLNLILETAVEAIGFSAATITARNGEEDVHGTAGRPTQRAGCLLHRDRRQPLQRREGRRGMGTDRHLRTARTGRRPPRNRQRLSPRRALGRPGTR